MSLLRSLLVAASLAATAAAATDGGAQGRYFPGLPTPLAPFIDFYETHLDPEEFVVLRGLSGTLAFVTFSFLMLVTNMGYLPINPARLYEDYEDYEDKPAPYVLHDYDKHYGKHYGARSIEGHTGNVPLSAQLPGCLPLLLCSMELAGWTVPLQPDGAGPSPPGPPSNSAERWTRPGVRGAATDAAAAAAAADTITTGGPCRRFKTACSLTWFNDLI